MHGLLIMCRIFALCAMLLMLAFPLAVQASLTITELRPLSFGTLLLPGGSRTITVDCNGGAPSGSAEIVGSDASRGEYMISGDQGQSVTIDIDNISTGNGALTLTKNSFKGRYAGNAISSFPQSSLPDPAQGTPLYLGATLEVSSGLSEQSYHLYYDIIISYQ
jgi:hypothetical protein